jgi:hypothetical protein
VVVVQGEGISEKYRGIYRPVSPHGEYVHYENENGKHLYNAWEAGKRMQWCLRDKFAPTESEADAFFEQRRLEAGPRQVLCSRTTFLDQRYCEAQGAAEEITIVGAVGTPTVEFGGATFVTPAYANNAGRVNGKFRKRPEPCNGRVAYDKVGDDSLALWWSKGSWMVGSKTSLGEDMGYGDIPADLASPKGLHLAGT